MEQINMANNLFCGCLDSWFNFVVEGGLINSAAVKQEILV